MNVLCGQANPCAIQLSSECVVYQDVNLPYIGVTTNMTIEDALKAINEAISEIEGGGISEVNWGDILGNVLNQTDLITYLQNTYLVPSDIVFDDDVTFVLNSGDTFGKYSNGETAPWQGLTAVEAILDAAIDYIDPVFTSFSVSGQSTTVEVGTTLSGSKTFTWAITANSGVIPTIDLYDITAVGTLLAGTPNDGSQAQTVNTLQLNSNGSTQQWRGIGNNTSPVGTFNSSTFTVTSRYYRFFGPDAEPTNSAEVRALPSSTFHTGATTFTLETGTTSTTFVVALPPGVTISSVIDLDALNANITSEYILQGTINVLDAGGTNRAYNIYLMTLGAPYAESHTHSITTNN